MADRDAMSIQEVADKLGVSRDLVNDAIRDGQIKSVKLGSRRIIPVAAYEEFLASAA